MADKALIVIDMQKDLCYDPRRKARILAMLKPLIQLIDAFSQKGLPVIYICFALKADDEQFTRFGDRYCVEGTEGAEIIPELYPLRGPVIFKRKHSAFFETNLDETLQQAGVKDVYLTGLQTQICIMTTAADASFRGYRPIAVSDCVFSTREKKKREALSWIREYVGEVQSLPSVYEDLAHVF